MRAPRPNECNEAGQRDNEETCDHPFLASNPDEADRPVVEVLVAQDGDAGGDHTRNLPDRLAVLAEPTQEATPPKLHYTAPISIF